MAWENAVVTNGGLAMLRAALDGKCMTVTRAAGAAGVADPTALMAMTALVEERQTLALIGIDEQGNTKRIKIQVASRDLQTKYIMRQVGVFARLDGEEAERLLLVMQDETGVEIPAGSEMGEYVLELYALLAIAGDLAIEIVTASGAMVSLGLLDERLNRMAKAAVGALVVPLVVPAAGWARDADGAVPGYGYCAAVEVQGCTAAHYPDVAFAANDLAAAAAAGVCRAVETLDGALRFWARDKPAADLAATALLVAPGQGDSGSAGGGSGGGGYVLPIASAEVLGGVKIGDGVLVAPDGKISVVGGAGSVATDAEVKEMIEEVYDGKTQG